MKAFIVSVFVLTAMPVWAVLPEMVERACFSTELTDPLANKHWAVTSWEKWRDVTGLTIKMNADGSYVATLPGASHEEKHFKTSVSLASPAITHYQQQPLQTLTITIQAASFLKNARLYVELIKSSNLPPFTVKLIHNRMVMIANDKTWYIVIDDPKARINQTKENPYCVTVEVEPLNFSEKVKTHEVKLHIGEGEPQVGAIEKL